VETDAVLASTIAAYIGVRAASYMMQSLIFGFGQSGPSGDPKESEAGEEAALYHREVCPYSSFA
jgi:hypothetical protein